MRPHDVSVQPHTLWHGDESGLMKNAGEGMSGIERLAIHIAESYGAIAAALEGIREFCGRLA